MTIQRILAVLLAAFIVAALQISTEKAQLPGKTAGGAARLMIVGDSVARGAGDESGRGIAGDLDLIFRDRRMAFLPTLNRGINGARTQAIRNLLRAQGTISEVRLCDAVVVSIGGNDLFGDRASQLQSFLWPALAMRLVLDRVDRIVSEIRRMNPAARVYVLGLYNPYRNSLVGRFLDRQVALWDSRLIMRFAGQPNVDVVRIADLFAFTSRLSSLDHFHPSAEGYALIAQRIAATW